MRILNRLEHTRMVLMQVKDFSFTKAAYSVEETLRLLPLGRTSLYKAVKGGHLRAAKFGKKTFFLSTDIAAFLESLPALLASDFR